MKIFNHAHLGPCLELLRIANNVRYEEFIRVSSITALRDTFVQDYGSSGMKCQVHTSDAVYLVDGYARDVYNAINQFEV